MDQSRLVEQRPARRERTGKSMSLVRVSSPLATDPTRRDVQGSAGARDPFDLTAVCRDDPAQSTGGHPLALVHDGRIRSKDGSLPESHAVISSDGRLGSVGGVEVCPAAFHTAT